jgi:hypothetical protein
MAYVALLFAAFFICSCGGDPAMVASCTSKAVDALQICTEYTDPPSRLGFAKFSCDSGGGTWVSVACSRVNTLGGCVMPPANTSDGLVAWTVWYYPSGPVTTEADVMVQCTNGSGTFVPPS